MSGLSKVESLENELEDAYDQLQRLEELYEDALGSLKAWKSTIVVMLDEISYQKPDFDFVSLKARLACRGCSEQAQEIGEWFSLQTKE